MNTAAASRRRPAAISDERLETMIERLLLPVLTGQREICTRLERIERLVARQRHREPDPTDNPLIAAIAAAAQGLPFTVRALLRNVELTDNSELRQALRNADLTNGRELGWWFSGMEGRAIAGLSVARVDKHHRDGQQWRVVRVLKPADEIGE